MSHCNLIEMTSEWNQNWPTATKIFLLCLFILFINEAICRIRSASSSRGLRIRVCIQTFTYAQQA
jgi:hypothetical protein